MRASTGTVIAGLFFLSACTGTRDVVREEAGAGTPAPVAVTDAHFRVYTGAGQPAALGDVVAAMGGADVVFLGEMHDDPVAHFLQAELLQAAFAHHSGQRPVALSLEMFDRDVQHVLDEYLDSLITERHFLSASNPWNNYATDYRPMVEFARVHGLDVLAANAPRRYVNRVGRLGPASLDALGEQAKAVLPPLPYPGPTAAYQAKWNRLMQASMAPHGEGGEQHPAPADSAAHPSAHPSPHAAPEISNMLHAQALWDAGMAHTIAGYLDAHPSALVLHVVGGFHVSGGTGTPEALAHYRPGVRILNIALRPAADLASFPAELSGEGDFVVLTDAGLPRTFRQ